jgi:hypothetical protein
MYGKEYGKMVGSRRNLVRKEYKKIPKFVKETLYFICLKCGAFASRWDCDNKTFNCHNCGEKVENLFKAPKISNTYKCKLCWSEWKSLAIYKFKSCCRNCGVEAETKDIFFMRLYKEVDAIIKTLRERKLEVHDFGQDFNINCDNLRKKIMEIGKEIYNKKF